MQNYLLLRRLDADFSLDPPLALTRHAA